MKKIGIVTAHTGYNYGTYLQAYAMKLFLSQMGFDARIVWQKSFGPEGRDFRFKKMLVMLMRMALNHKHSSGAIQGYTKNFAAEPSKQSKELFDEFSKIFLAVEEYSLWQLKKFARSEDVKALVCGSDQIWSAASMYPDPLYYLQFAPKSKRIAYAPSFGKSEVPQYNKKRITKFLSEIPNISVRETAGAKIVKNLIGRTVDVMPDPTIIADWSAWQSDKKEDFLLVYFLDEPKECVIDDIKKLALENNLKIKVILAEHKCYCKLGEYEFVHAGPKEFVEIISKAQFVCTDSFHGTIFSIVGKTPFYTYPRNYGKVHSQNSRIETLLAHYEMEHRFRPEEDVLTPSEMDCDFEKCELIQRQDRERAVAYMSSALKNV